MKKLLWLAAAAALLVVMFGIEFLMVSGIVGLLGLAVDYLEMIIIASILIVGLWLLKTIYSLFKSCIAIAATYAWFDGLKKSVAAEESTQQQ